MLFTWRDEKSAAKAETFCFNGILLVIASEFSQQLRYIFPVVASYIQQKIIESAVLNN